MNSPLPPSPPNQSPKPSARAEEIFISALDCPPEERDAFVVGACAEDSALDVEVRAMLALHGKAGEFLDDSPVSPEIEGELARHQPEEAGEMIGPYELREQLGEGGFGTVWVADQQRPVRRSVALKIIKLGMDTKEVIARSEQERQALAMMDHPNIAKVFDAGATQFGRPYFVMELVRGVKITDYCDENHLPTPERLGLFIAVCQAVQHAHQKGIIHRDLKPSNILVTLHDGVPVPKVIDFGIAKATEGRLTGATVYTLIHHFVGTPAYMSPEQAEMKSSAIDTRSDIYSLGVLLYELLIGRTPFDAEELMSQGVEAMRRTIREKEPARPSTMLASLHVVELTTTARHRSADSAKLLHQLKGDLDWIVMKCLEKDRTRRYETASDLAADLKRYLGNEPVTARPPSAAYRFEKAFRRNKLVFSAATAVLAALAIGLAVSVSQAIRATKAEREQNRLRVRAQAERQRAETNAEKASAIAIQARRSQYAADMFAVAAQIEKGGYGQARVILGEHFPHEGLEELRGFEWRYSWSWSAGQQLKTFPRPDRVLDLAWSPDGRLLAEANADGHARLLHADTGEVAASFPIGSQWNVTVAFSHDGNGLAAGGLSGQVRFWDVREKRLLFTLKNSSAVRVACSPVDPILAFGTNSDWWGQHGGEVHLVDTTTGKELRVLPQSGDRPTFSPDGRRIATANWGTYTSGSQAVILWDVDSGQKLRVLENIRQVLAMAFSPDGNLLAIGTRHGEVILWNLTTFSHEVLRQPTRDFARGVAFSPDGWRLAVGLQNQELEIWDVARRRRYDLLRGHTKDITVVRYSPDGTRLASGCEDHTIRFWDPKSTTTVPALIPEVALRPHVRLGQLRFSSDSRLLAAAAKNGDVQIVDPATASWDVRAVLPKAGFPLGFSSDGATLLTLAPDLKTLHRWNATSGAMLSTATLNSTAERWEYMATTPDGSRLALATTTKLIEIFETDTGRRLAHIKNPDFVFTLAFSRDGQSLAIGREKTLMLWDIAANRVAREFAGHTGRISAVKFSPDQKTIATAAWDGTARIWDAASAKQLTVLTGHKAGVLECVFSPDGRTLVTGSDDRTMRFWNLHTSREMASLPQGYAPAILIFSPDGKILVTNTISAGLRCWRAPTLAEIDAAEAKERAASRQP